jgi:hypothetical protein
MRHPRNEDDRRVRKPDHLLQMAGPGKVDRTRHQQIPVAAKVRIHLFFGGDHEKVFVRELCRAFEVKFLLRQALGPRIGDIGVIVKVAKIDYVDPQAAEDGNPTRI